VTIKPRSDNFDRSRSLDGLRGMAAVAVIFYHAFLHNSPNLLGVVLPMPIYLLHSTRDVLSKLALSISNGEVAVHIFFVLSGLVLSLSLKRKSSSISPVMLSIQFAVARLMRLYPALIVCMAGFYGLSVVLTKVGFSGFPVFQFRSFL
jgi:peptidoglycan/LPS O-acetylase OafA/YrhL